MTEPKFKAGDVVQHKASRERGVIIFVGECICPNGLVVCEGFYRVAKSFGTEHKTVREIEIEKVEK